MIDVVPRSAVFQYICCRVCPVFMTNIKSMLITVLRRCQNSTMSIFQHSWMCSLLTIYTLNYQALIFGLKDISTEHWRILQGERGSMMDLCSLLIDPRHFSQRMHGPL